MLKHPRSRTAAGDRAFVTAVGAMVQWLKLPAWEVGDPHSVVFKFQGNEIFFPAHS